MSIQKASQLYFFASIRTLSLSKCVRGLHIRLLYPFIILLFFSCAQIVNPGGGPRDTTPPKALRYAPDSAALNFKSKQIRILFNEYIQLKDINNQLIISPPLKHQPDVRVKNKELIVDIEDTLAPNTTYAFNFGSGIADITESNLIDNFQYVFSTGPFIDSLSLSGTVNDAFSLNPEKGVLVMLYKSFDDSVPYKKLPNYFAKTKEDGTFRIDNIANGKYKVFALKDANANYLYDDQEERIAFLDSLVDVQKNEKVNLLLFKEIPKKQFIKRAGAPEFGHIFIAFNRPVADLQITPLNFIPKNNDWKIEEFSKNKDTLNLWLPGFEKDSIQFIISDSKKVQDTLEIAIPSKISKGRGLPFKLTYKTNVEGGLMDLNESVRVQFNHPLKGEINQSALTLLEDSVRIDSNSTIITCTADGFMPISLVKRTEKVGYGQHWKENSNYTIQVMKNSVTDIFDLKNDTIKINFKTPELKYYGSLKLNLKVPLHNNFLLWLYDDKGNDRSPIHTGYPVKESDALNFELLPPGNYKIRLVYNSNENTGWDTGNYLKHQQPEKVIYYPNTIIIRSNWDLEQEWKIKE
jgi:hypothetical protein